MFISLIPISGYNSNICRDVDRITINVSELHNISFWESNVKCKLSRGRELSTTLQRKWRLPSSFSVFKRHSARFRSLTTPPLLRFLFKTSRRPPHPRPADICPFGTVLCPGINTEHNNWKRARARGIPDMRPLLCDVALIIAGASGDTDGGVILRAPAPCAFHAVLVAWCLE